MLYGLGVGLGLDPLDPRQLKFVTERNLVPLPSFVTVAVWDVAFKLDLGIEWSKLIQLAQAFTLHRPLAQTDEVFVENSFTGAFDKPGRGSLLLDQTLVRSAQGELIAELEGVSLARDFHVEGAPEGSPPRMAQPPNRPPDYVERLKTSPQVALLYRLLGGRSDIHWEPERARAEGFDGPIMHGLCTYGHACHAIIRGVCDYQPERLQSFAARFARPVYPGEHLSTSVWVDNDEVVFETRAEERDVVVLADGQARTAPTSPQPT